MKSLFVLWSLLLTLPLAAHDSWVEINTVRTEKNQPVYASLMLGNHGNDHRDFKLASKLPLEGTTLALVSPHGRTRDLKSSLIDNGLAEKEGFLSVQITPRQAGPHTVLHTFEAIMHYAPKRVIRSGKAFFVAEQPGAPADDGPWFARAYGDPLEMVPLSDPVRLETGDTFRVRLLYKGQPLADTVVSCIPRGVVLKGEFDRAYEARTDANGDAAFTLRKPNFYLIVAHQGAPEETGEGYSDGTAYAATMTLQVRARSR
ncbi:MAG TPA: DUF4198 domain-containing protein [Chthoniobacteraceae bacterium]|nr:DUF4198 domain-containing protein [Chthoniobacteraceae bacterium]